VNLSTISSADQNHCRLCDGKLESEFELEILNKYDVQYFECQSCHSLQTEPAYWLAEAYGTNLSNLDTGAVQRNWHNFYVIYLLCRIFKLKNILDLGGGDGLLCRSLRDYELNCFVQDQYATPTYAQGFTEPNFDIPDLVLGFEVWEHLPNPLQNLERFFNKKPKALLITTAQYENQGADWWYLSAQSGQHIFFYSPQALELIAKQQGYALHVIENFLLFIRIDCSSKLKLSFFKSSLRGKLNRYLKYKIMRKPTPGVWKDYLLQKSLSDKKSKQRP
jgi:2-polyprenyl-3-methyl-5-hydroxy-6-metoxy-1,4-benzoquinol methylase